MRSRENSLFFDSMKQPEYTHTHTHITSLCCVHLCLDLVPFSSYHTMKPRKRQRNEKETSSTQSSPASSVAPKINQEDGTITFSLSTVHDYLICELCDGYYRDPYTITDCLHTFCKSCLFCAVECGCYECPSPGCKVYLGKDPLRMVEERNAVSDRGLQEFIDRIVFPDIVEQEQEEEKKFYEQQQNNKTSRKSPPQEAMMKRKSETIPSQSSLSPSPSQSPP